MRTKIYKKNDKMFLFLMIDNLLRDSHTHSHRTTADKAVFLLRILGGASDTARQARQPPDRAAHARRDLTHVGSDSAAGVVTRPVTCGDF